jgi:outer membrane lipoprotein-sorting protein
MLEMHRFTPQRMVSLLFILLLTGTMPAMGQSVQAVVDAMKARYQQELEAVDTYIIETDQYTSYHRKTTQGSGPMYETAMRWHGEGSGFFRGAGATPSLQPSLAQLDTLAQVATYEGTETIDGRRCHILRIDDLSALSASQLPPMAEGTDDQGSMRMYIDAERSVPLRMEMEVTMTQDGETRTLRPRVVFSDYRTTDGLMLPWMMEMTMDNLNASMSPEEREQARRSLEEMEQRLEQLPEEQRRMMEGAMKGQLDQLRSMLDEGTIRFAVEVQDVQVNTPLPDGVFDGN